MSRAAELIELFEGTTRFNAFTEEFTGIISTFNNNELDYAIIGAIAYSEYANPRATSDIDILMLEDNQEEVYSLLESRGYTLNTRGGGKQLNFKAKSNSFGIKHYDIIFAVGFSPEGPAIMRAKPRTIFGVKNVKVAIPEDLVMLWLDSIGDGNTKAYLDAEHFINNKLVDIKRIRDEVKDIMGSDAEKYLLQILAGKSFLGEAIVKSSHEESINRRIKLYFTQYGKLPPRCLKLPD